MKGSGLIQAPVTRSEGLRVRGPFLLERTEATRIVKTHKHTHQPKTRGLCLRCRKRVPPVARKHGDPFCSRVCAEATYGTGRRSKAGTMVVGGVPIGVN